MLFLQLQAISALRKEQFRNPLEHGNQRPPAAQWTATASGSVVIGITNKPNIVLTYATLGKVVDQVLPMLANGCRYGTGSVGYDTHTFIRHK